MLEKLGQTDIYLIDQVQRGRIRPGMRLLDAGCGAGRNSEVHLTQHLHGDVYRLPDGSTRYLLDREVLEERMNKWNLHFVDPVKTVNVADVRTMSVVAIGK